MSFEKKAYAFRLFITKLVFAFLCFSIAKSSYRDYMNGANKENVELYKKMINENSFVYVNLPKNYTEQRIGRSHQYTYSYNLTFEVKNKKYFTKMTFDELPEVEKLKLYYLQSDPNIHSLNPVKGLEHENSKKSYTTLIVSIVFSILFLIFLYYLIRPFFKK